MKNTLQTFKQNFVNGALIDGTMLVDVDCNCDNVIIPDDTEFVYRISRELDLSKVKKMTVHSVEFLNALTLGFVKQFPKHINEKEDIDIANKVNHLYTYASTVDDQQNIAIEMIKRNPKDMTTRKFIRESSDNIISRMKHDKNEKGLVDMVKLEFIKNESLHQMLQFAENEHLSALTAYILGTINNDKAQKEIQKKKLSL